MSYSHTQTHMSGLTRLSIIKRKTEMRCVVGEGGTIIQVNGIVLRGGD